MTANQIAAKPIVIRDAINLVLADAMADDNEVIVPAEDVAVLEGNGGIGVTTGRSSRFSDGRVHSEPVSEQAIIGCAISASLVGYKAVVEIMIMNFTTVALDMIRPFTGSRERARNEDAEFRSARPALQSRVPMSPSSAIRA